jgi:hypothetical protein
MGTLLNVIAMERSTLVIRAAFTDEDGNAVVPDSLTWTLTDRSGTTINSRKDVVVGTPAAEVDIVLSGDDLEVTSDAERWVTIEGTYTSTLGAGLPLTAAAMFVVENLLGL